MVQRSFKGMTMLLLLLSLIVTACTGNNAGNPEGASGDPAPTAEAGGKTAEKPKEEAPAAEAIDPYRMPEPATFTTFKHLGADAKLPEGDTVEDNQYTRYLKEKANIEVEILWYASGNDYEQKSKLAIGSGDIPDVMFVDEQTFKTLANAGQLEDLTEVYEKYKAPLTEELYASTNGMALEKATIDGKLLAIPNIAVQADALSMVWVRQDWLDKLGLEGPKTVSDVEKIAKAFVDNKMGGDGTIGLTAGTLDAPMKAGRHNLKGLFGAYNAYPGNWVRDGAGNLAYGSILPETKAALGKIRDMYAAGLIDKEFAIRKDTDQMVISGKAGMFFGPWWSGGIARDTYANFPDANFKVYAVHDDKGQLNNLQLPVSSRFMVVRKGMKHPEAAIVYINTYIRSERKAEPDALKLDATISTEFWPIGNGTFDYADAVERKSDLLADALAGKIKPEELKPEVKLLYDFAKADEAAPRKDLAGWGRFWGYTEPAQLLKVPMNSLYNEFTTTTKTMERKWANLKKLEEEYFYAIVMGNRPLDDFDKFVSEWKAQGGDEITTEVQAEVK
ncbi:extracellular solute-binding protein [Paenibacillus sp.]|uniref:extracellular solute-binding protein n=1 Tax=Paenibacillus sp. TaxID=58172 RepID=UPI002811D581|nr:extracellular solute-binding protein [Paenibacillus sp.]